MEKRFDRRSFLRVSGTALSIGALYSVFPALTRSAHAEGITRTLAELNGETPAPLSFMQLSDTHVGFNGPPDPLGTQAFESAVATINGLKSRPELIIVTGDLTHDADSPDEHAKRFKLFKEISEKSVAHKSRWCRARTTLRSTAATCSANSWVPPTTHSIIVGFISSRSTTSRPDGPRWEPLRSRG